MKKSFLILLALCVSLIAFANPVDVKTANGIAKKFIHSKIGDFKATQGVHRVNAARDVELDLVYESASETGQGSSEYYVFAPKDSEGFVIVSGEDNMTPVLGYSLTGNFMAGSMPPALENLLASYANYVDDVRSGRAEPMLQSEETITPIEPLIKTTWDQSTPYNNYCPVVNGKRAITGCVPTAIAQIMKYYEWPKAGHGECTSKDYMGKTYTITLGEEYDWDNMKDIYQYMDYTDVEAHAIATLMNDVGHACRVAYKTDGTSGNNVYALNALLRHFDYSPSAKVIEKAYYSDVVWKEILYKELSYGRPVFYGGMGDSGGHAYVLCGIDHSGAFYINWGWSGLCDGYYYLDALMPPGENYSNGQYALICIKPIEENESEADYIPLPQLRLLGITDSDGSLSSPNATCLIGFRNATLNVLSGEIGYALFEEGEMISHEVKVLRNFQDAGTYFEQQNTDIISLSNLSTLSQGVREIRFLWRPEGNSEWYAPLGDYKLYIKTFADRHLFFTNIEDTEIEEIPEIPDATIEDGVYYLKNVATGQYLTVGNDWGTHASVGKRGLDLAISRQANGKYVIETQIGSEYNHYLGSADGSLYMDVALTEWRIGVLENGNYVFRIYDFIPSYMAYDKGSLVSNIALNPITDDRAQWQLFTREDLLAELNNATAENPVDATFFIPGANFGRSDLRNENWSDMPAIGGVNINFCAEKKFNVTTFNVGQTVTGLPNGFYELRMQGFYCEGEPAVAERNYLAGTPALYAMLYANEETTLLSSIMSDAKEGTAPNPNYYTASFGYVPQQQVAASYLFYEGHYQHRLRVEVTDGTLNVGVKKNGGSSIDWTCFDNFELYYYGKSAVELESDLQDGVYYLKNAATGRFLTAANDWGTRASAGKNGLDLAISRKSNGKYIIETGIGTEETKHFLGMADGNLFMDALETEWTIGLLDNGNYVFTMDGADTFLGFDALTVASNIATDYATDKKVQWQLLTREDLLAELENATAENPVDATFLIPGAGFGRVDSRNSHWNGTPKVDGINVNYCAEKWNVATFDVGQVLTGVPNGLYELRMQGFYREGSPDVAADNYAAGNPVQNAFLYANDATIPLVSIMSGAKEGDAPTANYYTTPIGYIPQDQYGASGFFSDGAYVHNLRVEVSDGTLRIGVRKNTGVGNDWACFDNFELYYYGEPVALDMHLLDSQTEFVQAKDMVFNSITYTRDFQNTDWQPLYVPFDIPYGNVVDDFDVADINNVHQYDHNDDGVVDETVIEAFKVTGGTLAANYPYLIRAKSVGEKVLSLSNAMLYATVENSIDCSSIHEMYTFAGTYKRISSSELNGCYTLADGEWQPVTTNTTIGSFRFYLKVENRDGNPVSRTGNIRMRVVGYEEEDEDGGETSIGYVDFKSEILEIYDLQGRRIEKPTKGIYIVNGRKVLVK